MFTPSMVLPPGAWIGAPALPARMIFGDLLPPVSPLALVPIGLAILLYGCLLVAMTATRRHDERRIAGGVGVEPEASPAHRHAA